MDLPRRRRLRPSLIGLVLVAILTAGALEAWSRLDGEGRAANPAAVVAAQELLRTLPTPAGAARDGTSTACGVPWPYCVTGGSASSLLDRVLPLLSERGAKVRRSGCGEASPGVGLCSAELTYSGARLGLQADESTFLGRPATPWLVVFVAHDDLPPQPASRPLPPDYATGLLPPGARGGLPCLEPVEGGCRRYDGTVRAPGAPTTSSSALERHLTALGFRVVETRCKPTGSCLLLADRFRGPAGADPVTVSALLTPGPAGDSELRLRLSAD